LTVFMIQAIRIHSAEKEYRFDSVYHPGNPLAQFREEVPI